MEFPTLSGQNTEWIGFADLFEAAVNSNKTLSNVEKFSFLKSCMKGDAVRLLKIYTLTGDNYKHPWDALIDRYANRRAIVKQHTDNPDVWDPQNGQRAISSTTHG